MKNASYFLLFICLLFLYSCEVDKPDCKIKEGYIGPTETQRYRFAHLINRTDSFLFSQFGDTNRVLYKFNFIQETGYNYQTCGFFNQECGYCTVFNYHTRLYPLTYNRDALYSFSYDYIEDTVRFSFIIGGFNIHLNDLHNPNAPTYIGNYLQDGKTYIDVHHVVDSYQGTDVYLNDSNGLISYKRTNSILVKRLPQ